MVRERKSESEWKPKRTGTRERVKVRHFVAVFDDDRYIYLHKIKFYSELLLTASVLTSEFGFSHYLFKRGYL